MTTALGFVAKEVAGALIADVLMKGCAKVAASVMKSGPKFTGENHTPNGRFWDNLRAKVGELSLLKKKSGLSLGGHRA